MPHCRELAWKGYQIQVKADRNVDQDVLDRIKAFQQSPIAHANDHHDGLFHGFTKWHFV